MPTVRGQNVGRANKIPDKFEKDKVLICVRTKKSLKMASFYQLSTVTYTVRSQMALRII